MTSPKAVTQARYFAVLHREGVQHFAYFPDFSSKASAPFPQVFLFHASFAAYHIVQKNSELGIFSKKRHEVISVKRKQKRRK